MPKPNERKTTSKSNSQTHVNHVVGKLLPSLTSSLVPPLLGKWKPLPAPSLHPQGCCPVAHPPSAPLPPPLPPQRLTKTGDLTIKSGDFDINNLGLSIAMGLSQLVISWKIPSFEMDDDWG